MAFSVRLYQALARIIAAKPIRLIQSTSKFSRLNRIKMAATQPGILKTIASTVAQRQPSTLSMLMIMSVTQCIAGFMNTCLNTYGL